MSEIVGRVGKRGYYYAYQILRLKPPISEIRILENCYEQRRIGVIADENEASNYSEGFSLQAKETSYPR